MKPRGMLLIMMASIWVFLQSGCVKKIGPVSSPVGLDGAQSESFDDPSAFIEEGTENTTDDFPVRMDALREETIRDDAAFKDPMETIASDLDLRDIFFQYDQASLKDHSEKMLRENARYLLRHPSSKILVAGHTDERGSNEYNLVLGARRARTVKRFLVVFGIASDRIEIISYGEENPFCNRSEENCWRLNRRAHFLDNPE